MSEFTREHPDPDVVVHACPVPFSEGGDGLMPCCGRTPFEVEPWGNRVTLDPALVTCKGTGGEQR